MLTDRRLMLGIFLVLLAATVLNFAGARRATWQLAGNQKDACRRGNVIRLELNTRAKENRLVVAVLEGALAAAASQSAKHAPQTAETFRKELAALRSEKFKTIALVDCGSL